ncbi:hypothetical protein LZP73_19295, partial [Shewanella sp. AS16]|uniref:hypothetical protein n=1 Tax=Shewanella sp. AS16 TaxID=2907625 RepID=UPI001F2492C4
MDGYTSTATGGDWRGIRFNDAAPDNASPMEYVSVRYAGESNIPGISYNSSHQRLAHAEVSNSAYRGIYSNYSNVSLEEVAVFANRQQGVANNYGNISASGLRVFANGDHGLYSQRGSIVVDGGEIFANGGQGAYAETSTRLEAKDVWWGAADGAG